MTGLQFYMSTALQFSPAFNSFNRFYQLSAALTALIAPGIFDSYNSRLSLLINKFEVFLEKKLLSTLSPFSFFAGNSKSRHSGINSNQKDLGPVKNSKNSFLFASESQTRLLCNLIASLKLAVWPNCLMNGYCSKKDKAQGGSCSRLGKYWWKQHGSFWPHLLLKYWGFSHMLCLHGVPGIETVKSPSFLNGLGRALGLGT